MSQAGKEMRETEQSEAAPGAWVVPPVSYVDPTRRFCAYCGRPLARRFWERRIGGEARAYCGPDHASRSARNDISAKIQ